MTIYEQALRQLRDKKGEPFRIEVHGWQLNCSDAEKLAKKGCFIVYKPSMVVIRNYDK